MSKVYFLHVDTSSTAANTVIKSNGTDSFNCSIILGKEHRKLRRAALKCAEIPLGFYNIRAPYNNLTINVAGTLNTYTFSPGNYTATTFLNTLTNTVQYTSVVGASSIVGDPGTLGYFMGFQTSQVGVIIVAAKSYNIDFDNYICIYIENLRNSCMEPFACTFKIPITVQKGGVQNYLCDSYFKQSIEIFDPDYRIDRLNIQVRDRFGNPLSNNGIDWSMTLELESDT
jgi:hypothetical protein